MNPPQDVIELGRKLADPATAFMDPFCAVPTLSLTCTIAETGTKEPYSRNPRGMAQKGEKYLASTGVADSAVFGDNGSGDAHAPQPVEESASGCEQRVSNCEYVLLATPPGRT